MGQQLHWSQKLYLFFYIPLFHCQSSFFSFCLSLDPNNPLQNLTLLLVIITSALHLWLLISQHFVPDFAAAIRYAPGSTAAFIMSVLVLGPVAALFFYHVRVRTRYLADPRITANVFLS